MWNKRDNNGVNFCFTWEVDINWYKRTWQLNNEWDNKQRMNCKNRKKAYTGNIIIIIITILIKPSVVAIAIIWVCKAFWKKGGSHNKFGRGLLSSIIPIICNKFLTCTFSLSPLCLIHSSYNFSVMSWNPFLLLHLF